MNTNEDKILEAVESGQLISIDSECCWRVAVTSAVYADVIESRHDRESRRAHLAQMLLICVRAHHTEGEVAHFEVLRVPRGGTRPEVRKLVMQVCGNWLLVSLPEER